MIADWGAKDLFHGHVPKDTGESDGDPTTRGR